MLWGIRIAFIVLMFLFVLAVVTSCAEWRSTEASARNAALLAAENRRTQVIADIARLTFVLKRTGRVEDRLALESVLAERRAEIERLNAVIAAP